MKEKTANIPTEIKLHHIPLLKQKRSWYLSSFVPYPIVMVLPHSGVAAQFVVATTSDRNDAVMTFFSLGCEGLMAIGP